MTGEVASFLRYVAGLRGFLRQPLGGAECLHRIKDGLERREEHFLAIVEHGIYAVSQSPYRALLAHAGVELGDVRTLVSAHGIEGALERLHASGVHVTLEEFKRRRPIVRPGLELALDGRAFDNPLVGNARLTLRSEGSRGRERHALVDLDHLEHEAVYMHVVLEAFALRGRPICFWRPVPPGAAGLKNALGYAKLGIPVSTWFSQTALEARPRVWRDFLIGASSIAAAKLWSPGMPWPRHVPVSDAVEVAGWLERQVRAGRPALVETTASSAVRVCSAALQSGLEIRGTFFRLGGEPYTRAKAVAIEAAGCRAIAHYSMNELARAGIACAAPSHLDDVHLVTDKLAVIQRELESGGETVGSLLLTTLLPSSPKLMLNVESDDHGVLERRSCGCPIGEAGFDLHLHTIRSAEKLTSEGMNFLRGDIVEVVELALPSRFGGSPTDYQLVEQELDGLPKVSIVVSPRIGPVDDAEVVRVVLDSLGSGPGFRGMMAGIWGEGEVLRVERREPYTTGSAKILPLHVLASP